MNTTSLSGVWTLEPKIFHDFRGEYIETFHEQRFQEALQQALVQMPKFVQECVSTSRQHVVRGFHGSFDGNWKLVQVVHGAAHALILDNNPGPQYLHWEAFPLNDKNRWQLLIAPGYGNSFCVMSEYMIYHYQQTQSYHPEQQFTLNVLDPTLKISWPIAKELMILSDRDRHAPFLEERKL